MNWYIAKIVFNIANGSSSSQFDEQLRLITAQNEEEAFIKARSIGQYESDTFLNEKKSLVKWEFVDVAELMPLNKLEDGIEIYSNTYETDEAQSYIYTVHQKAKFIQNKQSTFELNVVS